MKQVVSVSIGSKSRDKEAVIRLLGEEVHLRRTGVDGLAAAEAMVRDLDGKVDAIGLGGTDLYLFAAGRRYVIRDAARLARAARVTPVADGSGLKDTLERETVAWLNAGPLPLRGRRVLLTAAVDRFGMAEAMAEAGADLLCGDLMFALGIPIGIRGIAGVRALAPWILPVATRLPFELLYPTGGKQELITPKYGDTYAWAEVLAGDWHYIRRHLPPRLDGKTVLTNTLRAPDIALLRDRGLAAVVTTTPRVDGESFGTNVMEAALVAVTGGPVLGRPRAEIKQLLDRLEWQPEYQRLTEAEPGVAVAAS
jgi:hypothetical protein